MENNFYISTKKEKLNLDIIHDYLSTRSYWARGRSIEKIKKSVENSLCFGVYDSDDNLVGFARVVSDFSVFAWIMDVFILEDYRKLGLGKMLVKSIMEHPELQGLQRWGLSTTDAHGLYEKFGFRRIENPETLMEIRNTPE